MAFQYRLCFLFLAGMLTTVGTAVGAAKSVKPQAQERAATIAPGRETWQVKWDKLVADAKKEGKVVIYADAGPYITKPVKDAFEKKFDIEVEYFTARPPELAARMFQERKAGMFNPDLINLGPGSLINTFKPAGVIDSIEPLLFLPEVIDGKKWFESRLPFLDEDRRIFAMTAGFRTYIMRNKNLVKDGEIKSYRYLLHPKWKRRMIMDDPRIIGSGTQFIDGILGHYMKYDEGLQFLKDLVHQEPVITNDIRLLIESVARGKYAIGLASRRETTSQFVREGAPIAWVYPEEGGEIAPGAGCLSLINKAPHPNAAALFANWLLTKEGQTAYAKGTGSPSARVDVPTLEIGIDPDTIRKPGVKVFIPKEEFWKKFIHAQQVFKSIFEPLLN